MPTVKSLWAAVSTGSASLRRENKGKLHCELGVTNVIAATAPFPPPEYGSRFSWTSGDDSSAESESETEDAWQPLPSASSTFQTLSISLRGHPYSIGYLEGLDREADREDIERGGLGHSFWKSIRRNAWRTSTGQDEESGVGGSVTAAGGFAASVWAAIQTRVSVVPVEDSEMDVGAAVDLST
ncbi:hypothetical protein HDU82_006645 [Entophlyctis luteolus]|nr:hypothetical protein HDU82_006645 [Entophlyctis luteolus]